MWIWPVLFGWLLVAYAAAAYIGKRRVRLWLLFGLVILFAASFAGWGFLYR